jgi:hypothetical protein
MPRRRMLDPSFFDDMNVSNLTRDERLFLLGCVRNSDDEGRLNGHPAYLKAQIFMYDTDIDFECIQQIKDSTLKNMESWRDDNIWLLIPYQNGEKDYLYFPNWSAHQKPSHPTPSKLPSPPDILTKPARTIPEDITKGSGGAPPQYSLGQSSLGQVSIGKVREVQEDFTKVLNKSESDLTDFLTKTLTKYISAGREQAQGLDERALASRWGIPVLEKFWGQAVGEMPGEVFGGALEALKKYPLDIVARAFVKAVRYRGGKYQKWKYVQTILDEQAGKGDARGPP